MADGLVVVLAYSYFSLMFIFKFAYKKKYHVVGNDRREDQILTRDEVQSRYGDATPSLDPWTAYGLPIAIGALVLLLVIGSIF